MVVRFFRYYQLLSLPTNYTIRMCGGILTNTWICLPRLFPTSFRCTVFGRFLRHLFSMFYKLPFFFPSVQRRYCSKPPCYFLVIRSLNHHYRNTEVFFYQVFLLSPILPEAVLSLKAPIRTRFLVWRGCLCQRDASLF